MKIQTDSQQPSVPQAEAKTEAAAPAAVKQKKAKKSAEAGDCVDFSSAAVGRKMKAQQDAQAERVQSIKTLVKSGKYHVDARDVAEKMLAREREK